MKRHVVSTCLTPRGVKEHFTKIVSTVAFVSSFTSAHSDSCNRTNKKGCQIDEGFLLHALGWKFTSEESRCRGVQVSSSVILTILKQGPFFSPPDSWRRGSLSSVSVVLLHLLHTLWWLCGCAFQVLSFPC